MRVSPIPRFQSLFLSGFAIHACLKINFQTGMYSDIRLTESFSWNYSEQRFMIGGGIIRSTPLVRPFHDKLFTVWLFNYSIVRLIFDAWVERILIPELPQISVSERERLYRVMASAIYSDLNPIEKK